MNTEHYILIQGRKKDDIERYVQAMCNLYADLNYTKEVRIFSSLSDHNTFVINFANLPDFERFKYFVNYLALPEPEPIHITVRGYWTISLEDNLPSEYVNQKIMLYVSDNDLDGDNVYAIFKETRNTYILGFSVGNEFESLNYLDLKFNEPKLNKDEFQQFSTIHSNPDTLSKKSGCILMAIGLFLPILWM